MPVNKKALSMARVITRNHIHEGQAKLAADAQKAEEKAAKKAAREAAKKESGGRGRGGRGRGGVDSHAGASTLEMVASTPEPLN